MRWSSRSNCRSDQVRGESGFEAEPLPRNRSNVEQVREDDRIGSHVGDDRDRGFLLGEFPDCEIVLPIRTARVSLEYVGDARCDTTVEIAEGFSTRPTIPVILEWTLGALDEVAIGFLRAEPLDCDADLRELIDCHRFEPDRIDERCGGFAGASVGADVERVELVFRCERASACLCLPDAKGCERGIAHRGAIVHRPLRLSVAQQHDLRVGSGAVVRFSLCGGTARRRILSVFSVQSPIRSLCAAPRLKLRRQAHSRALLRVAENLRRRGRKNASAGTRRPS